MAGKSLFSCRIVDISSYCIAPVKDLDVCYSEFRSSAVSRVPVIRIFGATPAGQKTCLHVHGVFPYIYVPCPVADVPSDRYLQQLGRSLDQALQVSLGNQSKLDQHHVFKITVVKGIPMYGYHDNEEFFLKIYLYNPAHVKRLSDLLSAGVLMEGALQPHEAHIPFVLQFMIDYNLYGMNFVHFSSIKFRSGGRISSTRASPTGSVRSDSFSSPPLISPPFSPTHSAPSSFTSSLVPTPSQQVWNVDTLPSSMVVCVPRDSESELEVDGIAADILNRHQLSLSSGGFPGLAAIWEEERQRRKQLGLHPSLSPPPSPDRLPCSAQPLESEMRALLDSIVEERLGESLSSSETTPPSSTSDSSVPQSCDTESHRPTQPVARRLSMSGSEKEEGEGPVVDEEAIHQTMEMSQRLQIEALRKSTDEELLDLMLELAQTPVTMGTQSSQSVYQTPSVAQSLSRRLKKSLSTPTMDTTTLSRSQPVCDNTTRTGFLETSFTTSQPVLKTGSQFDTIAVEEGNDVMEEDNDVMKSDEADEYLVTGEDLLNKSDRISPTRKTSPTSITTESETGNAAQVSSARCPTPSSPLLLTPPQVEAETSFPSPQSPVFCNDNLFDNDFPLDPPLTLSPPRDLEGNTGDTNLNRAFDLTLEGENEPSKNLSVMLNSSAIDSRDTNGDDVEDSGLFESQFDIPCAQPLSSPDPPLEPQSSQHKTRNESINSSSSSLDRSQMDRTQLETVSSDGGKSSEGVQLEFEMPEISLSQFEAFQNTTAEILGTPSKMAATKYSPAKEMPRDVVHVNPWTSASQIGNSKRKIDVSGLGQEPRVVIMGQDGVKEEITPVEKRTSTPYGNEDSPRSEEREMEGVGASSRVSPTYLSSSQRRRLLLQLSSGDVEDLMREEDEGEVGSVCESETEGEDEEWRSGQWSVATDTIPESPQELCGELDGCIRQLGSNISQLDDTISQLDGTPDESKKGYSRKKTLGLRKRPRKSITNTHTPPQKDLTTDKLVTDENERSPLTKEKEAAVSSSIAGECSDAVLSGSTELSAEESSEGAAEQSREYKMQDETIVGTSEEGEREGGGGGGREREGKNGRESKTKLSLSLKSHLRKRRRHRKLPSLSPSHPPRTLSQGSGTNSRTLILQWKASALHSPPRIHLHRISLDSLRRSKTSSTCLSHFIQQKCTNSESTASVGDPPREKLRTDFEMISTASSDGLVTGSDVSLLEEIVEPEQDALSSEGSPQRLKFYGSSPSEASSQAIESDFNLVMTESDSEWTDVRVVSKPVKRQKVDDCGDVVRQTDDVMRLKDDVMGQKAEDCGDVTTSECHVMKHSIALRDTSPFHSDVESGPVPKEIQTETDNRHEMEPKSIPMRRIIHPLPAPPTATKLCQTAVNYGLPTAIHTTPFYSNPEDVQLPKEVNQKFVRIPSKMAYDLPEWEPVLLAQGAVATPLSATGVKHWRTVLSMLSGSSQLTIPPPCHPPEEPKTNQFSYYSADDHQRDVRLRSSFLPQRKVVLSPLRAPPTPQDVIRKMKAVKKSVAKQTQNQSEPAEGVGESSDCDDVSTSGAAGMEGAPVVIESESETKDQAGTDLESSMQLDQGQTSFTSYQVPKLEKAVDLEPATPFNEKSILDTSLKRDTSQIEGPTPQNTYGFKISQSAFASSSDTHEYVTSMSVELHIRTRGSLRPDPEWDPVLTVFYYIHHDYPHSALGGHSKISLLGVIAIDIKNSNFVAVHSSRQSKGKSPRKPTIGSPRQQIPTKSPAKSPKKRPIKSSDDKLPQNGTGNFPTTNQDDGCTSGVFGGHSSNSPVVTKGYVSGCVSGEDVEVKYVSSETELLEELVSTVRRHDPDILLGYDVTMTSWGYLIDRAATLNLNLTNQLSRIPHQPGMKPNSERVASSGTGTKHKSPQVHIPGRILLSVWRLLRKEIAVTSYTFENMFFQVMHQRVPMFSFRTLTHWYEMGTPANRSEVVEYYLLRCHGNYQLLDRLNLIGRTSEFARLYGMEFENVLTRGTQYRVEAMLLRLAKPANYIAVSPSVQQRARMAAPECLQLILEPESKFYSDPVLVLDFQSLYPSIVIAYNYCYTTCLGRVRNLALHGDFTFGTNSLNIPPHVLKKVKNSVSISPNEVVFVNPTIRKGLMPRMLEEILGTRIMVKSSMKQHRQDKALNKMLDARQMGLKLIANVTYGYTAANFSGRMPCVEIADSIVGKARETLERAIRLISATPEWGARVVYGDTDSVFVLLKGASKEDAFRVGKEICERVTADNPKPVKLKFEKVYYPCILQTKKRYCGYMYETPDQTEPCYDAKGIETVRRDTCPAVPKILQKSLSLLFSSRDVSQVKSYVQRQFRKLLDGNVSLQDYILAKEYRGRSNYRPGACVPALELARRAVTTDPRAEPLPGERVPYVVVYGHPGQPMIQLVRPPLEVVKDCSLRLNGVYYITKQVLPALDRALSLLGVDVHQWYSQLPRVFKAPLPQPTTNRKLKGTLGRYFATMQCPICNELTTESMCSGCRGNPQRAAVMLSQHIRDLELAHHSVTMLCQSCTRSMDPAVSNGCISLDCPVFYRRLRTLHSLTTTTTLTKLSQSLVTIATGN